MTRPARLAAVVEEATVDAAGPVRAVMATGAAAEPGWEPLAASKAVIAWLVSDIRRVVQARPPSDVDSKLRPFTLYQLLVTRVLGAAAPNRLPPGSAAAASVRSRPAERVWTAMFHAGRGGHDAQGGAQAGRLHPRRPPDAPPPLCGERRGYRRSGGGRDAGRRLGRAHVSDARWPHGGASFWQLKGFHCVGGRRGGACHARAHHVRLRAVRLVVGDAPAVAVAAGARRPAGSRATAAALVFWLWGHLLLLPGVPKGRLAGGWWCRRQRRGRPQAGVPQVGGAEGGGHLRARRAQQR